MTDWARACDGDGSMLSVWHNGRRRESALNDNGRFSSAWHEASPADVGIMAVANERGRSIDLTYVADGVLMISTRGGRTRRGPVRSVSREN
jgi:hypothetical protein